MSPSVEPESESAPAGDDSLFFRKRARAKVR
jgi:hypothetical protein